MSVLVSVCPGPARLLWGHLGLQLFGKGYPRGVPGRGSPAFRGGLLARPGPVAGLEGRLLCCVLLLAVGTSRVSVRGKEGAREQPGEG